MTRTRSDDSRTAALAMSYFLEPDPDGAAPAVLVEFVGRHAQGGAAVGPVTGLTVELAVV